MMNSLSKKKLARLAYYRVGKGGDYLDDVVFQMIRRANTYNIRVICVFNDTQIVVRPGISAGEVLQSWLDEQYLMRKKWEKSMRGEIARRREMAQLISNSIRGQEVRQMLASEKLRVPLLKRITFRKFLRKHSKTWFDAVAVNFAMAWGVAMQQALREGKKIDEVAGQLRSKVDYENIGGFQYSLAVWFLVRFWKHGEEFRKWHNLDVQPGLEGEEANKIKGAVLKPHILTFGEKI